MDEMIIRSAQSADVEALANLMSELGYPTSSEQMRRRFEAISDDPSYATLVAERERAKFSPWRGSALSAPTDRTTAVLGSGLSWSVRSIAGGA
jgi:hypothetical protein